MSYSSIGNTTYHYSIKNNKTINYFDRINWGPKLWDILHTFSYNYSMTPTRDEQINASNYLKSLCLLLPCDFCKDHCSEFIRSNPPRIDNRNNLINWVLLFHNNVNRRLHKQTWTRQQLDEKFETGNAFCQ